MQHFNLIKITLIFFNITDLNTNKTDAFKSPFCSSPSRANFEKIGTERIMANARDTLKSFFSALSPLLSLTPTTKLLEAPALSPRLFFQIGARWEATRDKLWARAICCCCQFERDAQGNFAAPILIFLWWSSLTSLKKCVLAVFQLWYGVFER